MVDTSAIFAVLYGEPEAVAFRSILASGRSALVSSGTAFELFRLVQVRIGLAGWADIDRMLERYGIAVAPTDAAQLAIARDGMARFGQGRGRQPAVLNFGDLFAYALARHLNAPLLFKGGDFSRTDVTPAWTP